MELTTNVNKTASIRQSLTSDNWYNPVVASSDPQSVTSNIKLYSNGFFTTNITTTNPTPPTPITHPI
jgi:hypothetical protein